MRSRFRFRALDKARFYAMYFLRKVFALWFEVKRPKLRMFAYEMIYSCAKLPGRDRLVPSPFGDRLVETRFGRFRVRPRTLDMSNVSPAFEREDIDRLLKLIGGLVGAGRRTLFLDIGADIGTFTVTVGNRFVESGLLSIIAFEPAPSSFEVLRENISMNGLDGIARALNVAAWSSDIDDLAFGFNPATPGSSGILIEAEETIKVKARTLDSALGDGVKGFDAVVIKMDVEGAECEVLRGASGVLGSAGVVHLLVEDFIDGSVVRALEDLGAEFEAKLTPYNSWWVLRPSGDGN